MKLKAGCYFLGHRGRIYGSAQLGDAFQIHSKEEWAALRPKHCVESSDLPYKKTWALPVKKVMRAARPVPYTHPRGAIGVVKYRAP